MFHFDYFRANHIEEVCSFLQQHGDKSRILAGGTDLMVQIHEKDPKWAQLEWVVDISALQKELRYVREEETEVHIGALSTHTDLETSPVIQEYFPLLSAACASVGSPQIRNMGTIGGSRSADSTDCLRCFDCTAGCRWQTHPAAERFLPWKRSGGSAARRVCGGICCSKAAMQGCHPF